MVSHKSPLLVPNCLETRIVFQSSESKQEGPAAPFIFMATFCTNSPLMSSNTTGCTCLIGPLKSISSCAGSPTGCFSCNCFMVSSLIGSIPLLFDSLRSRRAAFLHLFAFFAFLVDDSVYISLPPSARLISHYPTNPFCIEDGFCSLLLWSFVRFAGEVDWASS